MPRIISGIRPLNPAEKASMLQTRVTGPREDQPVRGVSYEPPGIVIKAPYY